MKKIILILLIAILAAGGALTLSACSGTTDTPGSQWVDEERLTYKIIDNENDAQIGKLTVTTKSITESTAALPRSGVSANLSYVATSRALITMVAVDNADNEIMYSESIMDGFSPLASYKSVNYNGTQYTVSASYDGKHYTYSLNGGEEQKLKIKSGFCDNELLYTIIRCYSLDSSYSGSFTVADPLQGTKATLNVTYDEDIVFKPNYICTAQTGDGVQSVISGINATTFAIYGSETPVGQYAYVTYANKGTDSGYLSLAGKGISGKSSYQIPLIIIENNLTYQLTDATAVK